MKTLDLGLISDTHAVFDPTLNDHFASVHGIMHAGDIGHNGGTAEILEKLKGIAPVLAAVRGNVDDLADAARQPECAIADINGWKVLVHHIVGVPPRGELACISPILVSAEPFTSMYCTVFVLQSRARRSGS
jgi:predicted phosphodiesterase